MPKPMKRRDTSNPIGLKFHKVMEEKGIVADYAAVARAFGVATPSVYDWIDHGRIGKDRYRQLVEWSGRQLDWWFDIAPSTAEPAATPQIQQNGVPYVILRTANWPFTKSFELFSNLSEADRARIDGYITSLVDASQHRRLEPEHQDIERQGP